MIKVVTTHEITPPPASSASRVEVLGADLASHPDLTLCVRFITYQFGSLLYNYQGILFVDPLREGFKVERAKVEKLDELDQPFPPFIFPVFLF